MYIYIHNHSIGVISKLMGTISLVTILSYDNPNKAPSEIPPIPHSDPTDLPPPTVFPGGAMVPASHGYDSRMVFIVIVYHGYESYVFFLKLNVVKVFPC